MSATTQPVVFAFRVVSGSGKPAVSWAQGSGWPRGHGPCRWTEEITAFSLYTRVLTNMQILLALLRTENTPGAIVTIPAH